MSEPSSRVVAFTDAEEEFFRAGATVGEPEPVETFSDLEEGYRPPKLLRRLFGRPATQR